MDSIDNYEILTEWKNFDEAKKEFVSAGYRVQEAQEAKGLALKRYNAAWAILNNRVKIAGDSD